MLTVRTQVMSDWLGTKTGLASVEAGLDMDMPGGIAFLESAHSFYGQNITYAVDNGTLSIDRVDDMCRRIMTPFFYLGQDSYPAIDGSETGLNYWTTADFVYNFTTGPSSVDVRDDHATLIRELGAAGMVLLKNVNSTLPLKTPKNIGVFGNDAGDFTNGLYFESTDTNVGYEYGVFGVGGGSGTGRFTYVVPPLDAIKIKAAQQNNDALVQYVLNNTLITSGVGL